MPAPEGNRFWEARATHGRDKIFSTPEMLRESCLEYFQWVEEHPLYESKAFHNQGEITYAELPKMRAMTMSGLCIFLGICQNTWTNYKQDNDLLRVIKEAEQIIYTQKFTGASADLLNANIIARDLGLAERKEHTGKDGGAMEHQHTAIERTIVDPKDPDS